MRDGESAMLITAVFLVCVVERLEERFFLVIVVLIGLRFRQVLATLLSGSSPGSPDRGNASTYIAG